MNGPLDPLQRHKSQLIATVFGINLIFGVLIAMMYPGLADPQTAQANMSALRGSPVNFGYQIAILVVCFLWLALDSRQLDIRRPWWLNVGIVVLTSVFVPYYLYKTRPAGHRAQAIMTFFGIVFGGAIAMMFGMVIALVLAPAAAPTVAAPL